MKDTLHKLTITIITTITSITYAACSLLWGMISMSAKLPWQLLGAAAARFMMAPSNGEGAMQARNRAKTESPPNEFYIPGRSPL